MSIVQDKRRTVDGRTTPQIKSEKASCAVVIHRYKHSDVMKLVNVNISNGQSIANRVASNSSGNLEAKGTLVIRQDIVRCSVSNDKSGIGGTFSVNLKKGKQVSNGVNTNKDVNYVADINVGDWITIYMKRVKEISDKDLESSTSQSGLKMVGIIESVREIEVDDPGSAIPRLDIVITGRSFGKVFDTNIFFNPAINQAAMQTVLGVDFLNDSNKTLKPVSNNTPDQVINKLIKFYMGSRASVGSSPNENWYVPQSIAQLFRAKQKNKAISKSFIDILDTTRIGLHRYVANKFSSVTSLPGIALIKALPTHGTIWSVMQFLQNQAANEMYTELVADSAGNLRPGVVLRQLPFSNKKGQETNVFTANEKYGGGQVADSAGSAKTYFTDLPKYSIVSSDIRSKNIGKSDHERINYVIVTPKILDEVTVEQLFVAGSNVPSIQRYGLKMFQTQTSYVLGGSQNQSDGIKKSCYRIISLLEDWFFLSHNLFNGTLLVDGVDGFVEVGTNLYVQDIQHLFHIESYTHTYAISPTGQSQYVTEFRVSRGQKFDSTANKSTFIGDSKSVNDPTTVVTSFIARSKQS